MLIGYWCAATAHRAMVLYWRNFGAWLIATIVSGLVLAIGLDLFGQAALDTRRSDQQPGGDPGGSWSAMADRGQRPAVDCACRTAQGGAPGGPRSRMARKAERNQAEGCGDLGGLRLLLPFDGAFGLRGGARGVAILGGADSHLCSRDRLLPGWEAGVHAVRRNGMFGCRHRKLLAWGLPLLGVLFAAGLIMLLGYLLSQVLGILQAPFPPIGGVFLLVQLILASVLVLLIRHESGRINVNRFSMHGVYRNRLMRAFLGAARTTVRPIRSPALILTTIHAWTALLPAGGVAEAVPRDQRHPEPDIVQPYRLESTQGRGVHHHTAGMWVADAVTPRQQRAITGRLLCANRLLRWRRTRDRSSRRTYRHIARHCHDNIGRRAQPQLGLPFLTHHRVHHDAV